ncbi:DUF6268 family outer membrane beta-barrel protein [Pedobacter caeni]|uniref:DUF6268 domain-containing protein n=1 Tax=Pedobacter caeni TaxID=288992 RepID=A0A1M5A1W4_9SPHI|nr:DUF6268 family outer membrane beta-barrel protein [Pedobacter caeni]SHF24214.1 hypothetical protein SAMN04488522_102550 [Pedobacter caeni]
MKTIALVLFALALIPTKLFAQDREGTPLLQATSPSSVPGLGSFEANYSSSPFKLNGTKINIEQIGGTFTVPVMNRLKDGRLDFLLIGASYNGLFLSGVDSRFGGVNFHAISIPVTFQKAISEKYAIVASFVPSLSSDLKDVSGDDMTYSGALMLKINHSKRFNYSLGAAFARQFFGTVLVPVVAVDWKVNDKLSFSGILPVSGKIKYQLSEKSAFGALADFAIGGGSYRLSKKMNADYLQIQQIKTALFYEYALSKKFSVELNAGYNFKQQLDRYSKDQKVNWIPFNDPKKREPLAEMKSAGFVAQTGIKYRF